MKEENYKLLVSQIESLIAGEKDMIAVMSNVAAAIHQGPVACMHIPYGKGVCGT